MSDEKSKTGGILRARVVFLFFTTSTFGALAYYTGVGLVQSIGTGLFWGAIFTIGIMILEWKCI